MIPLLTALTRRGLVLHRAIKNPRKNKHLITGHVLLLVSSVDHFLSYSPLLENSTAIASVLFLLYHAVFIEA